MNIDRKRFPIIQQVQNGKLDLPMTLQELRVYSPFISIVESVVRSRPTIDYLCISRSYDVIGSDFQALAEWLYETRGVLLLGSTSMVYRVKLMEKGSWEINIFQFQGKRLTECCKVLADSTHTDAKDMDIENLGFWNSELLTVGMVNFLLHYLHFKKNVEVVDKVISTQTNRTCKTTTGTVKTDYKYPINVIDEAYYTTYIIGEKFSVRSHPRHLASGKVVEVRSFEKSGYTRKAKKLSMAA